MILEDGGFYVYIYIYIYIYIIILLYLSFFIAGKT